MDERPLIWAAGVADARMRIRLIEDKTREMPEIVMNVFGPEEILRAWARVMRLREPEVRGRQRKFLKVGFREQERVARELLPYVVLGERLEIVTKLRELMWKRDRGSKKALVILWKEVKRRSGQKAAVDG